MRALLILAALLAVFIVFIALRTRKRETRESIPLSAAMAQMKTGDLVLFSRRLHFRGGPIETLARIAKCAPMYIYRAYDGCEFNHVAIIYKDPESGRLFLLHCPGSNYVPDSLSGERVAGVQLNDLKESVDHFRGYCVWRPINRPISDDVLADQLRKTYSYGFRWPLGE